jgi:hypothetical protein
VLVADDREGVVFGVVELEELLRPYPGVDWLKWTIDWLIYAIDWLARAIKWLEYDIDWLTYVIDCLTCSSPMTEREWCSVS